MCILFENSNGMCTIFFLFLLFFFHFFTVFFLYFIYCLFFFYFLKIVLRNCTPTVITTTPPLFVEIDGFFNVSDDFKSF